MESFDQENQEQKNYQEINTIPQTKKLRYRRRKFLIPFALFFLTLVGLLIWQRVAIIRVGKEYRLLINKTPISRESITPKRVTPQAGGYYSKTLNINLSLFTGLSGTESLGKINLSESGKKGEIIIERYKTEYGSLEEAEKKTKNETLKNAVKTDFSNERDVSGKIYDIQNPASKIYFFYVDRYIYTLTGTNPEIYKALNYVAKGIYFGDPYKGSSKVVSEEARIFLKRKTPQGTEAIFEFNRNGMNYIVRWNDYLFFAYPYGENNIFKISQHDLKTGKTKTIFEKENKGFMLSDLNIINNTLYFYVGAYLAQGESYWIDLFDPVKTANKLSDIGGVVVKIKGSYFFIKSEGDACWGRSSFSLIDLTTKKLTPVAETKSGCLEGEEYIGIDDNAQMILASHTRGDVVLYPSGIYKSLVFISLNNGFRRSEILLPRDIVNIDYIEEGNKLLLTGKDEIYTFSFKSNNFESIVKLGEEWSGFQAITHVRQDNQTACISKADEGFEKVINYVVDLDKKNIIPTSTYCSDADKPKGESEKEKAKKVFKSLNLPPDYIFEEN